MNNECKRVLLEKSVNGKKWIRKVFTSKVKLLGGALRKRGFFLTFFNIKYPMLGGSYLGINWIIRCLNMVMV